MHRSTRDDGVRAGALVALLTLIGGVAGPLVTGAAAANADVTIDVEHTQTAATASGMPYTSKIDVPHVTGANPVAATVNRAVATFIDDARRQFVDEAAQPSTPGGPADGANALAITVDSTFVSDRVASIALSESIDLTGEAHSSSARASLTFDLVQAASGSR